METSKKTTIPNWVWVVPILFGALGGTISWAILRKRKHAGWLFIIGFIVTVLSNMLFQAIN